MSECLSQASFPQRMFWLLDQLEPDIPAYNLARALRIEGALNVEAMRGVFRALLRRHDVLRMSFFARDGELFQRVPEYVEFDLPVQDLSRLPAPLLQAEALKIASEEGRRPFDLEHSPLLRATLLCLSPEQHVIVLVMHHIVTDGWSMGILFREIAEFYGQLALGRPPRLARLPLQYSDFARWQREQLTDEALKEDLEYWEDKLRGCPTVLELPTDRPRPAFRSPQGSVESFTISRTLTSRLKDLCAHEGATVYMGLLAVFQLLLSRYTGTDDILVGTALAGRDDPEFAHSVGCFLNTCVIRGDLTGNPDFLEFLARVRVTALGAYAHQRLPMERLLTKFKYIRTANQTPLFQVMFVLHNVPESLIHIPGLVVDELEFDVGLARFDLTLDIVEKNGALYCKIEYRSELFERSTIQRMTTHFQNLLVAAIENPAVPIARLKMLGETEQKQILFDWNATAADYSKELTITQAFEDQVQRTPDAIALREGARTLTYRELDSRANQVARALVDKGAGPDMPVGVYMKRSIDAIVALLGVLKIGSPYVPLEVSQPKHRVDLLITAAECRIVVTHRALQPELPEVEVVLLDADMPLWTDKPEIPPAPRSAAGPAYIIFTSGSTGIPKGVVGTHRATMNRLEWMYRTYPFSSQEVCCQKTALSFVDSIWEIFGPLLRGVPNIIFPEEVVIDPELLIGSLARERVTRIVLVPTLLRVLLEHAPDLGARVPELKLWTASGEELLIDLARKFRTAFPEARLLNLYGSSEVAGDATCYEVGEVAGLHTVPIGKPISNTQMYVLDDFMEPLPIGVPGMLYVGGDCVSPGYWRRPDLTHELFISHPFAERLGSVFATGDRARWHRDGNLKYLGREDAQTKLRGFRIELGEIEANLMAHPLVRQAAVLVSGTSPEARGLTAYVVGQDKAALSSQELREFLRTRLPAYMVPPFFLELSELPLLPSGKIDRRALPPPSSQARTATPEQVEPRDEIERRLVSIWGELLEIGEFGVTNNFFELGGNSLLAMQVLARVRKAFEVEVSILSFFDGPSIEELRHEIEKAKTRGAKPRRPPIVPRIRAAADRGILSAELDKLSPE